MPFFFVKLTPNGRMVAAGAAAGPPPADFVMEMFAAFQESMSFATFSANTDCVPEADRRAATAELVAAARRGELRMAVHEMLPPGAGHAGSPEDGSRRGVRQDRARAGS
jgi:NADPH2:quinone reductase